MKPRPWTPSERARLKHFRDQGLSYREIGKILRRSKHACNSQARPFSPCPSGDIYETDYQAEMRRQLYGDQRYR